MMFVERTSDEWPCLFEVDLPVFREKRCKGRFFGECAGRIIGGGKGIYLRGRGNELGINMEESQ